MNDESIEQEIQAKGLTAPRVTPQAIEDEIAGEFYFTGAHGLIGNVYFDGDVPRALDLLTFCVLLMRNGYTVVGHSACASPENFDAELGCKIARQNAVNQLWPLMGYELRSKLSAD